MLVGDILLAGAQHIPCETLAEGSGAFRSEVHGYGEVEVYGAEDDEKDDSDKQEAVAIY